MRKRKQLEKMTKKVFTGYSDRNNIKDILYWGYWDWDTKLGQLEFGNDVVSRKCKTFKYKYRITIERKK